MFYKKKRKKGRVVILLCFVLLFAGFTYGYISNNKALNKPQDIAESSEKNYIKKDYQINSKINKGDEKQDKKGTKQASQDHEGETNESLNAANEDLEIVFNTYYEKTGKIDTKKTKIPTTIAGITLNEFESYIESNYEDWEIKSISDKSASLFKQVNGYNPNYFIIQNKEGYIVVYKINEAGQKELYEKTDIAVSILSEMDKKKLDEGIIAKSVEELYRIIEDYSS